MIFLIILFFYLDWMSKFLVKKYMNIMESKIIINNFFNITYVNNTGAAFSIMNNNKVLVLIISIFIILGVIVYIFRNKPESRWEKLAYSLIIGGSLGNLFNRIFYGYVIDFLDFNIFGYNYPIFNLADVFIVCGVIILIIYTWGNKNEDRS